MPIYIFHSCAYANYYARLCQCFKCQNRADDDGNAGSCADAALFMPFYDILCLLNSQLTFATVADLDSMGRVPCFARPGPVSFPQVVIGNVILVS